MQHRVAPRKYCDICEEFDLHDTDDCPVQGSDDDPALGLAKREAPTSNSDRPYCDVCEGKTCQFQFDTMNYCVGVTRYVEVSTVLICRALILQFYKVCPNEKGTLAIAALYKIPMS